MTPTTTIHLFTRCLSAALLLGLITTGFASDREPVSIKIELDRAVLPAEQSQKAVIKVSLDSIQPPAAAGRPAVNLAIVLDRSSSMNGDKIVRAREAAIEAVRRLDARDMFSLVTYNSGVQTVIPAQSLTNPAAIIEAIRGISVSGSTALFGGVSQGAAEVRKHLEEAYFHRVLLLSDGQANVGPSSPDELGRLGAALIKEGISVTTIGVGLGYNEDLMTELARRSDGNMYFAEHADDLATIFQRELGDVLNVVAKEVTITIECAAGVRPIRIIGRDGRIDGDKVEIYLNQLYGGNEKYALIEVAVPAGKPDATQAIAVAKCQYQDMLNDTPRQAMTSVATVRYSTSAALVEQHTSPTVTQAVVINEIAIARDEAIKLMDKGQKQEAVKLLERVNSEQQSRVQNDWGNADELKDYVEQSQVQAEKLSKEGMDNRSRKIMRQESYKDKYMQ